MEVATSAEEPSSNIEEDELIIKNDDDIENDCFEEVDRIGDEVSLASHRIESLFNEKLRFRRRSKPQRGKSPRTKKKSKLTTTSRLLIMTMKIHST